MDPLHITPAEFTAALNTAVEHRGATFKYEAPQGGTQLGRCLYVHPTEATPGCLIGYALNLLGVPLSVLREIDQQPRPVTAQNVLAMLTDLPEPVCWAARKAQVKQDGGASWGAALTEYREAMVCREAEQQEGI